MEILEYRIPYRSRTDVFKIYCVADQHLGNTGCDIGRIKEDIEIIRKDPLAYWVQDGDAIDAVVLSDTRRFDPRSITTSRLDDIVMEQADMWLELYEPIKSRCIGILDGNHEESIRKNYHIDVVRYMCRHMKTAYLGDVGFIRVCFDRLPGNFTNKKTHSPDVTKIDMFITHGNVAGRKGGGKVNRLEEMMSNFDADIYMLAHGHKKITHSSTKLSLTQSRGLRVKQRKVVGFMTGAYLRTYQVGSKCYAEKGLYPPSDLGMVGVHIKPSEYDGKYNVPDIWVVNR